MTDDDALRRIRALLDKAESTEFPAEAESLVEKAQELMSKYAIDEAMLAKAQGRAIDKLTEVDVLVENPYAHAKSGLLTVVAKHNDVTPISTWKSRGHSRLDAEGYRVTTRGMKISLLGFASDVERVQALYASLLIQMTRAMLAGEKARKYKDSRGKTWRNSFLHGYANAISSKLWTARATAKAQAEEEIRLAALEAGEVEEAVGESSVALALRTKTTTVEEFMWEQYPHLNPKNRRRRRGGGGYHSSANDSSAWSMGNAAGKNANVSGSGLGQSVKGALR